MPKVILTCKLDDAKKWEEGFRTHGALFQTYGLTAPIEYSIVGDEVAVYMEAGNVDTLKQAMAAAETAEAMAYDGVQRDTVKMFVMDKAM